VYDDRHELDRRHVTAIAKAVELIEVRVPFAGHPAAGLLVEAGLLSYLVIQLIDESFDPDDFARRYIGLAPQTAAYNASLAAFLPAERLADKLRHARFAVKRQPASLAYRHLLSDLLMQAGEHDAAVAMLQELAEQHSSAAETHFALAIALEGAGRIPEAAAASRAALARAPHSPTLWRLLGRLAWRQNRPTAVLTATINTTWEWLPRWRRRFTAGR
jgi:tetratricopeptide (TPR) repeat protein